MVKALSIENQFEPRLIEYDTLKKLLNESYNEGDTPFTQLVGKYSKNIIKDNWFYLLIIIFILIIVYLRITAKKKDEQVQIKPITTQPMQKPKDTKYKNVSEYYTNYPRIK
jgi:hypothetical protein